MMAECNIRPYKKSDFDVLASMRNDAELQKLLITHAKPNSDSEVEEWIRRKAESDNTVFFVIASDNDRAVGFLQAADIDLISGVCRIGIALDKDCRGKGLFRPAMTMMEDYLKNYYKIRKVIAEILDINKHSRSAFEKQGYTLAGVLKEHYYNDNKYYDIQVYEKFLNLP